MLIAALILVAVAVILFVVDFMAPEVVPNKRLQSLAMAFFAGGVAAWLIDILHSQGKL